MDTTMQPKVKIILAVVVVYAIVFIHVFSSLEEYEFEHSVPGVLRSINRFFRNRLISNIDLRNKIWPMEQIHEEWHPLLREDRFPSVDERVQIYMADWYEPPNPNESQKLIKYYRNESGYFQFYVPPGPRSNGMDYHIELNNEIKMPDAFVMEKKILEMNLKGLGSFRKTPYCKDALDLIEIQKSMHFKDESLSPLVGSFGDTLRYHPFPVFAKYRHIEREDPVKRVTMPIVARFHSVRHFGPALNEALIADTPWYLKRNHGVYRGAMTGGRRREISRYECSKYLTTMEDLTDDEKSCLANYRCNFVLEHVDSKLVDARLSPSGYTFENDSYRIFGKEVRGEAMKKDHLLENKVMINFEGNDLSTGLKWQLLSKSVVLMPEPTKYSWAMEQHLEPWVHYIPMDKDGREAEEKIRWVIDNDQDALKISERATLWIEDILYHPDAAEDDLNVKKEMIRRYEKYWEEDPDFDQK